MAISIKLTAPPSDEDLLGMSERNPGFQFERNTEGELLVTPGSGEAGRREAILALQLGRWAESEGSGVVFSSSAGFRLADGSVLSPDAAWMPKVRWTALTRKQRDSFVPVCPDAVFEIASRTDSRRALRAKMQAYLANGARLAVMIDPDRRAVEIYMPGAEPKVLEGAQSVSLDPVLPGFTLNLAPIFE